MRITGDTIIPNSGQGASGNKLKGVRRALRRVLTLLAGLHLSASSLNDDHPVDTNASPSLCINVHGLEIRSPVKNAPFERGQLIARKISGASRKGRIINKQVEYTVSKALRRVLTLLAELLLNLLSDDGNLIDTDVSPSLRINLQLLKTLELVKDALVKRGQSIARKITVA
jgi:hypothetical protein